ncbi:unnamed protein product [Triticum turgidum subsp. durum]|uniref:DUF6817 domain-containing protein n=1 Tax=Triticum turgidum subsp. durum TaxID=4567 RepID=A0A9R1BGQ0_TRITD|nr:unnamed protein product [Triticum turgidum subsp. durum]
MAAARTTFADALAAARPYLRGEEDGCGDPALPALTAVLRAAGAGECWHKHGTFLAHLLEVYRILRLWGAPDAVARCGLYHSAYSNSYVNLAIFEPDVGRARVAAVVGDEAERLVHLFCVVPRQQLVHDDLLFHRAHTSQEGNNSAATRDEDIALVIPPVFDGCTKVLDAEDQKAARDLYWEAVCSDEEATDRSKVEELLRQSITKNPFVGEPRLVLAQMCLNTEMYEEAQEQAEEGLKLLLEWGSSWDKRMPWEGWVSWGRAMLTKAKEKDWPHTSFGILSLGLVK